MKQGGLGKNNLHDLVKDCISTYDICILSYCQLNCKVPKGKTNVGCVVRAILKRYLDFFSKLEITGASRPFVILKFYFIKSL